MKRKSTILLVDDEVNVLKSLKRLLVDTDYTILTAESGRQGLELFEDHDIHLVISDYRMPEMSGVAFLSEVKEKYPETVRIVLSGYADAGAIVDAINEGEIYKFVAKPWNDQDLLTTISNAIGYYQLRQENTRLYGELKARCTELEILSKDLENKVAERTKSLEMKNRALEVTHRIIDDLPVGVLGIDAEGTVVYMNSSLKLFINVAGLSLGNVTDTSINPLLADVINQTMGETKSKSIIVGSDPKIAFICKPLGGDRGVIGLFSYLDPLRYGQETARQPLPSYR